MDDTLKLHIHFPSSVYQQDVIISAEYNFDNITREYLKSQSTVEVELSNLQEAGTSTPGENREGPCA